MSTAAEKNEEFPSRFSGIVRALAQKMDVNRVLTQQDAKCEIPFEQSEFEFIRIQTDPVTRKIIDFFASEWGHEPERVAGFFLKLTLHHSLQRRSRETYREVTHP